MLQVVDANTQQQATTLLMQINTTGTENTI